MFYGEKRAKKKRPFVQLRSKGLDQLNLMTLAPFNRKAPVQTGAVWLVKAVWMAESLHSNGHGGKQSLFPFFDDFVLV